MIMQIRKIDKLPPSPSDNVREDMDAMMDYVHYLREQINFALNQLESEGKQNGQEE